MLRERIQYLCKQKKLTRKALIDGLIAQTHFSNILAGRYTLADDLAAAMGKRLSVTSDYLAKAEDCPDAILKQIERMAETALFKKGAEADLDALPLTADELALELAANLCAACLSYQLNDMDRYQKIHDDYLDFYLAEFPDAKIDDLPPALRKMFAIYKYIVDRSHNKYDSVLFYLAKLLELTATQSEMWIAAQKSRIEALLFLRGYDAAQEGFEEILLRVRKENLLHHLSGLHIMRSALYYHIRLYESAVVELAKAEEALIYITEEQRSLTIPTIYHNRILYFLRLRMYDASKTSAEHYRAYLRANPENTEEEIEAIVGAYLCAALSMEEDWEGLEAYLNRFGALSLNDEQRFFRNYHYGRMRFRHDRFAEAEDYLKSALDFTLSHAVEPYWLADICVMLGEIAERGKRYKRGLEFYKMAYQAIL